MLTLFLIGLILLALLTHLFSCKKISVGLLCLTLLIFFSAGSGILPNWLLKNLEPTDNYQFTPHWQSQNIIIVLGAGTSKLLTLDAIKPTIIAYSRIETAYQLYHTCKASLQQCTLLISGGDPHHVGQSEADVYQKEFLQMGVAKDDILLEPNSNNTFENAKFTRTLLTSHTSAQLFLVTSGTHMKRALCHFNRFGMNPIPIPSDYIVADVSRVPLAFNLAITDLALHEYAGMLKC